MKNKLEKQKTNPLDNLDQKIKDLNELYDEGPIVHDPVSNTFMSEGQLKKKIEKEVKNKPFIKIKKPIAQRRERFKVQRNTQVPLKIDISPIVKQKQQLQENNILKKIIKEQETTDPDLYKGLGTFFAKKF